MRYTYIVFTIIAERSRNMKPKLSVGVKAIFHVAVVICFTLSSSVVAQTMRSYVHWGAIGIKPAASNSVGQSETMLRYRPVSEWVGEKFLFLPQSKEFQGNAYAVFREDGTRIDGTKYVGRVAKVISIAMKNDVPEVALSMEDNQEALKSSLEYGCL